jgi:uncharacterized membrane protein YhiD involved in acid resistance
MNIFGRVFENLANIYSSDILNATVILSVLVAVFILSMYEFIVYRLVSHRALYNRSFNICVAILPYFISTIILSLQSDIVVTLGTIGALAIIRFRTAIKDPVDMLYILWSIHIGITCGCQLYELAVITSLVVTIVLISLNHISLGKRPYVLIFHCNNDKEDEILMCIKKMVRHVRIKSRNYSANGMDYVLEFSSKEPDELSKELRKMSVDKFSIVEYDNEDII